MKQWTLFALMVTLFVSLTTACGPSAPNPGLRTDTPAPPVTDAQAGSKATVSQPSTGDESTGDQASTDTNKSPASDTDADAVTAVPSEESAVESAQALPTDTPVPPTNTSVPPTNTPVPPTNTPVPPTDTPAPPPPTPEPLYYNLPAATLLYSSVLYASPYRSETVIPAPIPEGQQIFVMGRNATRTHLRVVWNTGVGWIPVGFTSFNNDQARLSSLPVFEHEPPACAIPLTTQFSLASEWTSDARQRIAVVADLFRSRFGDFPQTSLLLKVNDFPIEDTRREIVEDGQFSLKDVVFTIDQDLQSGDTLGYILETSTDEPLTFMATIFSVPSNCVWETR